MPAKPAFSPAPLSAEPWSGLAQSTRSAGACVGVARAPVVLDPELGGGGTIPPAYHHSWTLHFSLVGL